MSHMTRTKYKLQQARKPRAFHVLVAIPITIGIWVLPILYIDFLGLWGAIGVIVAFFVILSIISTDGGERISRQIFEESDEHTHDNRCKVCALAFGSKSYPYGGTDESNTTPEEWICRHNTNLSPTYNSEEVLEALYGQGEIIRYNKGVEDYDREPVRRKIRRHNKEVVGYDREAVRKVLNL